ncbi:MAG: hypothetical protein E7773_02430 [Sphingomonas sp.]|uniref:hypothetical protein n=1 Tax=Sphingomonas sp. TaxID=28214 RepID=UPI001204962C|nr:hypothetical protein [Sphingomonas sp.]THD37856.1 MAG: hypothetical protein E7773_02430 [Sphingomonas sp.]
MATQPAPTRYETSIDRVGLAIGAGGAMGGAIGVLLMVFAGTRDVGALLVGLAIGSLMTALSITALAALPWALLHAAGRRGPIAAAILGAAIGFVLFLGGQTYGYGMFAMPEMDARTLLYRWASGFLTSLVMAAMAAGIAAVMWRVAYRKVG